MIAKSVAVIILLMVCRFHCDAVQPRYNYSDKTLEELSELLGDEDFQKRSCAALFVGVRYRNPGIPVINGPLIRSNSPPPQLPIPLKVVNQLSNLLTNDTQHEVRSAALSALGRMKYCYDTTSIIQKGLADTSIFLRLSAARELITIRQGYKEKLSSRVIPTILECIEEQRDPEVLWIACYTLGRLGSEAKDTIPSLERLITHENEHVQRRAKEALAKITGRVSRN